MKDDQSSEDVSPIEKPLSMPILSPRYDRSHCVDDDKSNIDYNG